MEAATPALTSRSLSVERMMLGNDVGGLIESVDISSDSKSHTHVL